MKVAVCAGHHANSKGAINALHQLNEFDEATKVNNHLVRLLVDAGFEVHEFTGGLTHKVHQINAGSFDLALDIHFNADADHLDPNDFDDSRGRGAMVMYCPRAKSYIDDEPVSERRRQAGLMAASLNHHLGNSNLGARPGWYWGKDTLDEKGHPTVKDYFLRATNCAAFIPEPGYIDNNGFAEAWLVSNRHEEIAHAIFKGVIAMGVPL